MKNKTMDYTVEIRMNDEKTPLDINEPFFSDVAPFYGENHKKCFSRSSVYDLSKNKDLSTDGTFGQLSLNGLIYVANNFSAKYYGKKIKKNDSLAILKMSLDGGTSGSHAYKSAPFLFYDIDVKNGTNNKGVLKQENPHLFDDISLNNKVFDFMKSISLLTFRSSSRKGMAGILYCPMLGEQFIIDNKAEHIKIGKEINDFINREMDVPCIIDFDQAQNKFRQIRYIPSQKNKVELNQNYVEFHVNKIFSEEIKDKTKDSNENTFVESNSIKKIKYVDKSNSPVYDYNRNTLCSEFLVGRYKLKGANSNQSRYNRIGGDSDSMVIYRDTNTFNDFSDKIKGTFPFDLLVHFQFNKNKKEAYNYLLELGYTEKEEEEEEERSYLETVTSITGFIKIPDIMLALGKISKEERDVFYKYKVNEYKEHEISSYIKVNGFQNPFLKLEDEGIDVQHIKLSEREYLNPKDILSNMGKYITQLIGGCGIGKTSIFFLGKEAICTKKKVLFVSPRKILVNQIAENYKNDETIFASIGSESKIENERVEFVKSISNKPIKLFSKDKIDTIEKNTGFVLSDLTNGGNKEKLDAFRTALRSGVLTYDQFGISFDV